MLTRRVYLSAAKPVLAVMTALLLGVLLAGPAWVAETKITILTYGEPSGEQSEGGLLSKWVAEEVGPGIKLEFIGGRGKLDVLLASGVPLDAWEVYSGPDLYKYSEMEVALDLTPYFEAQGGDYWFEPALQDCSVEGRIYVLPSCTGHLGDMVYNRQLFAETGLLEPTLSWTTDDLTATARKLTGDRDGDGNIDTWGVGGFERFRTVYQFIWGAGGELFTADGKGSALGREPGSLRVMNWVVDLVQRGLVDPVPDIWESEFMRGNTGLHVGVGATWYAGFHLLAPEGSTIGDDVVKSLIPLDAQTKKRVIYSQHGGGYMINSASPHKDLTWKVLLTMVRHYPEDARRNRQLIAIPVIRAQHEEVFNDLSFFGGDAHARDVLFESTKYLRCFIWPSDEVRSLYYREWKAVYAGEQPISAMVEHLKEMVPALLQRSPYGWRHF